MGASIKLGKKEFVKVDGVFSNFNMLFKYELIDILTYWHQKL